jgi:DNA-binding MarR family transcriptional regulator
LVSPTIEKFVGLANDFRYSLFMTGSRIDRTATRLLSRANARAQAIRLDAFAAAESTGYISRLLASLADEGTASQAELSRRTGIDPSDVVAAINEMSANGFVLRTRDPLDGRRNVVSLTRAGRAELRRLDSVVAAIQERFLAPLTTSERRHLMELLSKLAD